jgi:hypothetical protein
VNSQSAKVWCSLPQKKHRCLVIATRRAAQLSPCVRATREDFDDSAARGWTETRLALVEDRRAPDGTDAS